MDDRENKIEGVGEVSAISWACAWAGDFHLVAPGGPRDGKRRQPWGIAQKVIPWLTPH